MIEVVRPFKTGCCHRGLAAERQRLLKPATRCRCRRPAGVRSQAVGQADRAGEMPAAAFDVHELPGATQARHSRDLRSPRS